MDATIDAVVNSPSRRSVPRVVVVGLASCFGCQLQITNAERYLLDVLGQIDLRYWQLASSDSMPSEYDVAVIEGAATTAEAVETLQKVRACAKKVIAIGSCAVTGGIPAIAAKGFDDHCADVYTEVPAASGQVIVPRPISAVIPVDYEVRCCPIDSLEFIDVLQQAIYGSNRFVRTGTLCGECKLNGNRCFYARGQICLGMVTRCGCKTKCVNLGRPCNGCRGLSPEANLPQARQVVEKWGLSVAQFDEMLELYNQVNPAFCAQVAQTIADEKKEA